MNPSSRLIEINRLLGLDVSVSLFDVVEASLIKVSNETKQNLRELCTDAIGSPSWVSLEKERIAVCKILVALFPDTISVIERGLERKKCKGDFEWHFSLFCFMHELQKKVPEVAEKGLKLVGTYLMNARSDVALSSWMAADMLGDHWLPAQSFEVLRGIATKGKYVNGRLSGLLGLEKLFLRFRRESQRTKILKVFQTVGEHDQSGKVRMRARLIWDRARGKRAER